VVAVLALYPAQAGLIRQLLHQNPILTGLEDAIEITIPTMFRQREAAVVLLSLTRSHTHRAVAFGSGPQALAGAMTRARSKVILFGDPGTLVRRSQWDGPLEHLDENAAARERQLITRLVQYLEGCGCHVQAAHSRQGSGT
jgi:superfamily I DNA and/or RNA helicase